MIGHQRHSVPSHQHHHGPHQHHSTTSYVPVHSSQHHDLSASHHHNFQHHHHAGTLATHHYHPVTTWGNYHHLNAPSNHHHLINAHSNHHHHLNAHSNHHHHLNAYSNHHHHVNAHSNHHHHLNAYSAHHHHVSVVPHTHPVYVPTPPPAPPPPRPTPIRQVSTLHDDTLVDRYRDALDTQEQQDDDASSYRATSEKHTQTLRHHQGGHRKHVTLVERSHEEKLPNRKKHALDTCCKCLQEAFEDYEGRDRCAYKHDRAYYCDHAGGHNCGLVVAADKVTTPRTPQPPRMRRWLEYPDDSTSDDAADDGHDFEFDGHLERTVKVEKKSKINEETKAVLPLKSPSSPNDRRPKTAGTATRRKKRNDNGVTSNAHQKAIYDALAREKAKLKSYHNVNNKSDCLTSGGSLLQSLMLASCETHGRGVARQRRHVASWNATTTARRSHITGVRRRKKSAKIDVDSENVSHHMKLASLTRPTVASRSKWKPLVYVTKQAVDKELRKETHSEEQRDQSVTYSDDDDFDKSSTASSTKSSCPSTSTHFIADDAAKTASEEKSTKSSKELKLKLKEKLRNENKDKRNTVKFSLDGDTTRDTEPRDTEPQHLQRMTKQSPRATDHKNNRKLRIELHTSASEDVITPTPSLSDASSSTKSMTSPVSSHDVVDHTQRPTREPVRRQRAPYVKRGYVFGQ